MLELFIRITLIKRASYSFDSCVLTSLPHSPKQIPTKENPKEKESQNWRPQAQNSPKTTFSSNWGKCCPEKIICRPKQPHTTGNHSLRGRLRSQNFLPSKKLQNEIPTQAKLDDYLELWGKGDLKPFLSYKNSLQGGHELLWIIEAMKTIRCVKNQINKSFFLFAKMSW